MSDFKKKVLQKTFLVLLMFLMFSTIARSQGQRWSISQAQQWATSVGWLRGANYQPHTAVNQIEMFNAATFDTATIDQELGWAEELGFNCMRVFIHHVLWTTDSAGFKKRLKKYLEISWRHHIGTMIVFFDDNWKYTYSAGSQPAPDPGHHNSQWVKDPGSLINTDPNLFNTLERYVKDILTSFAYDRRILIWDLYNEPGAQSIGSTALQSITLLKKVFEWGRAVNPVQPLTSGWAANYQDIIDFQLANSDIITYHDYQDVTAHTAQIIRFQAYGRPLICTEYMARKFNSTFQTIMPLLKSHNVGALNWGFVAGKTQTYIAWDEYWPNNYPNNYPTLWFHDILYRDGTSYNTAETDTIKSLTSGLTPGSAFSYQYTEPLDSAAINTWRNQQGWLRGCNFIPSTAINAIAMWRNASFDISTIKREIALARGLGYNVLRVNLSFNVWRDEQSSFYNKVTQFLEAARFTGFKVIFVLFDDTGQPVTSTLNSYTNPEPTPGVYRSNWSSSPINPDPNIVTYDSLHKSYVQGILQRFYNNSTIVMWDMYNEPKPGYLNLLTNAFNWARATSDRHPLTTALYTGDTTDEGLINGISYWQANLSDVLTFKFKGENSRWTSVIQTIQSTYNSNNFRPFMCLEYLARTNGNNFNTILNYGKQNNIGVLNGGLVSGKTNGIYTPGVTQPQPPQLWYQELYNTNGIPYSQAEILYIKSLCVLNYCP